MNGGRSGDLCIVAFMQCNNAAVCNGFNVWLFSNLVGEEGIDILKYFTPTLLEMILFC
jgi:hypothetical protein